MRWSDSACVPSSYATPGRYPLRSRLPCTLLTRVGVPRLCYLQLQELGWQKLGGGRQIHHFTRTGTEQSHTGGRVGRQYQAGDDRLHGDGGAAVTDFARLEPGVPVVRFIPRDHQLP